MPTKKIHSKNATTFIDVMKEGYHFSHPLVLGAAMLEDKPQKGLLVNACLETLNRHGLIAGATGTGKTRTLQRLAEELSAHGCAVLMMDIKGDLSGIAEPGLKSEKISQRQAAMGVPWQAKKFPVEFFTISNEKGVRLRATVSEFGPVLFSRILELNDTQAGVVALIFKYCDDQHLPLLDLKDFKTALQYLSNEGKNEIQKEYGVINATSANTILRKVLELEQQGADKFFGEKSFDVEDLLKKDNQGLGYINILRLTDLQSYPKLFATFMLCLLAEIYQKFPEEGEVEKPKLVIFMDEAHLIFDQANKTLLNQIEIVIKLIRSKGVGIFFCTQSPTDIPATVLSQLGMKIQHSLRAFTAKDRKAIKLSAENFPESEFYQVDKLLTELGAGEALVTVLNEKASPTPLVRTLICSPESNMEAISASQVEAVVAQSQLTAKYNADIDRESAYEMLNAKMQTHAAEEVMPEAGTKKTSGAPNSSSGVMNQIGKSPLARQIGRTLVREITRGIFGVLNSSSRRR